MVALNFTYYNFVKTPAAIRKTQAEVNYKRIRFVAAVEIPAVLCAETAVRVQFVKNIRRGKC